MSHKAHTRRTVLKRVGTGIAVVAAGSGAAAARGGRPGDNLVETAQFLNSEDGPFTGQFDVLIQAVKENDLVDTLTGNRQLTVFAPTDSAFGIDPADAGNVDADVLTYHVAPGRRREQSIVNASKVPTLNGETIEVGDELAGNFVATDVEASNGIIHAIGTVLDPED